MVEAADVRMISESMGPSSVNSTLVTTLCQLRPARRDWFCTEYNSLANNGKLTVALSVFAVIAIPAVPTVGGNEDVSRHSVRRHEMLRKCPFLKVLF